MKIIPKILLILSLLMLIAALFAVPRWWNQCFPDYEIIEAKLVYISKPQVRTYEALSLKGILPTQYVTLHVITPENQHLLFESHDGIERINCRFTYSEGLEDCKLISQMSIGESYDFIVRKPIFGKYYQVVSYLTKK